MIEAIFFDLDNTLIDRNQSIERFAESFLVKFKHQLRCSIWATRWLLTMAVLKPYASVPNALPANLASVLNKPGLRPTTILKQDW